VVHIVPLVLLGLALFYLVTLYVSPPSLALKLESISRKTAEPAFQQQG
jgi:hypothetical protein